MRFTLPIVYLGFITSFYRGPDEVHGKAPLHTVIIEPDMPRVSLVWHTALPCHPRVRDLKETVILEKVPVFQRPVGVEPAERRA
jgi:hypothetical protein